MTTHRHRTLDPSTVAGINRPPEVKVRQVIEVRFVRGEGCCDDDLGREVVAYFDLDGTFLAENDPSPTILRKEVADARGN